MSNLLDLIEQAKQVGVTLTVSGEKLLADPAGLLPEDLKSRLREWKPELILLLAGTSQSELEASAARLEASDILIAVWSNDYDAGFRLVQGEGQARKAWQDGATVYSTDEMLAYVSLSDPERRLFRDLKSLRPGGTT